MASTDPTAVGPELNFINTMPANSLQSVGSDRRDEDEDMNSAFSESSGLEYGTPTQNGNIPHILNVLENLTTNQEMISMPMECQGEAGMGLISTLLQKYRPKSY
jgi:hypothetical protein